MRNSIRKIIFGSCAALFAVWAFAQAPSSPKIGDPAPAFEAKDQDGKTWKLDELKGQTAVLLYFYPKDDTPGCTKQACGLRDRMSELKQSKVQVLGVSRDSAESHKQFATKHNLNFPLLDDKDGKLTKAYNAGMEGKEMARRVSFLISKEGQITHITDAPSADKHLTEMKDAVAKLK